MWGKNYRNKIKFCGTKYIIEPKYRLFYVSEDGEDILACRVPKNVIKIEMHRPYGKDIFGSNVIGLSRGDSFKVTIHNFNINSKMNVLLKSVAISRRYFIYKGNGIFEELNSEKCEKDLLTQYITLYNAF